MVLLLDLGLDDFYVTPKQTYCDDVVVFEVSGMTTEVYKCLAREGGNGQLNPHSDGYHHVPERVHSKQHPHVEPWVPRAHLERQIRLGGTGGGVGFGSGEGSEGQSPFSPQAAC